MSSITVVINTEENDDWIKRVHNGRATKQELEIHAEIAKTANKQEPDNGLNNDNGNG